VTPSGGAIAAVLRRLRSARLHVLIRPRGGDFVFDADEQAAMMHDIVAARVAGAHGVVVGALKADGNVDVELLWQFCVAARRCICGDVSDARSDGAVSNGSGGGGERNMHVGVGVVCECKPAFVTFHRAFDMTRAPMRAFSALWRCGVDCLLTSGGAATAFAGVALIRRLVRPFDAVTVAPERAASESDCGDDSDAFAVDDSGADVAANVDGDGLRNLRQRHWQQRWRAARSATRRAERFDQAHNIDVGSDDDNFDDNASSCGVDVMAGGGIDNRNVAAFLAACGGDGVACVHGSLRSPVESLVLPGARKVGVYMGGERVNDGQVEYERRSADATRVRAVRDTLVSWSDEAT
jgi:copper homeostasis protein CutC